MQTKSIGVFVMAEPKSKHKEDFKQHNNATMILSVSKLTNFTESSKKVMTGVNPSNMRLQAVGITVNFSVNEGEN